MPSKRRATGGPARNDVDQIASDLAQEHGMSESQENETREAFSLFCIPRPGSNSKARSTPLDQVLRREDVRRCLISLGIRPSTSDLPEILSTLDPTETGYIPYEPFLGLAAIYQNEKLEDEEDDEDGEEDYAEGYQSSSPHSASQLSSPPEDLSDAGGFSRSRPSGKKKAAAKPKAPAQPRSKGRGKGKGSAATVVEPTEAEIEAAYKLFTNGGTGPITIAHLRRVSKQLKDDVSEQALRDMVLEANGEMDGPADAWKKGVEKEAFKDVMFRAGVFG